jgi:hypothetical protein
MYSSSSEDEGALLMGDEDGLSDAEREFRAQCSRFLTQLGNAGGVIAGSDDEDSSASDMLDPLLERAIRVQLPEALSRYNAASRSLAAHLLLAVNAHYLTNSQTEEEFHNLMRAQVRRIRTYTRCRSRTFRAIDANERSVACRHFWFVSHSLIHFLCTVLLFTFLYYLQHRDMLLAWQLLTVNYESDPWETRTLDILRIQVAQCLKDGSLMLPLLKRMASHDAASWNVEEAMLLFTVAPLLGRWADFLRFGAHLREHFPESGVLHMSSMDYDVLQELAAERVNSPSRPQLAAPESQLVWRQYQIVSQRIRLVHVAASSDEMRADLETQFTDPETHERTWQVLVTTAASEVVRCGAIAQLKSFSPAGVSLVGPMDEQHMYVRGRFNMHAGRQRQVETYDMRRVAREELQGGGAEEADAEAQAEAARRAAEEEESEEQHRGQGRPSEQELQQGLDRDDALAARQKHGLTSSSSSSSSLPLPNEYWKGQYVMVQEQFEIDEEESGHGHSHGGVACGHNHGGGGGARSASSPSAPTAALTVTFELEFVLRPRLSPTDEEPTAAQHAAAASAASSGASSAAAAASASASSMLGSTYVLASPQPTSGAADTSPVDASWVNTSR